MYALVIESPSPWRRPPIASSLGSKETLHEAVTILRTDPIALVHDGDLNFSCPIRDRDANDGVIRAVLNGVIQEILQRLLEKNGIRFGRRGHAFQNDALMTISARVESWLTQSATYSSS